MVSSSPSQYKLPLFHPQLCPTLNVSGELAKRVRAPPVALPHSIAKYARTAGRGSRYGWEGAKLDDATDPTDGDVLHVELPVPGRDPPIRCGLNVDEEGEIGGD